MSFKEIWENEIVPTHIGHTKRFRNLAHLADVAGLAKSTIAKFKYRVPDFDTLDRLDKVLGTNLRDRIYSLRYGISPEIAYKISADGSAAPTPGMKYVPLFTAACGPFKYDFDAAEGTTDNYIQVETTDPGAWAVTAEGDSMIGAGIQEGDIILIEPSQALRNGDVCLCLTDDGATLKKYFQRPDGKIILQACNDAYEPIIINSPDEFSQLNLACYRATWKINKERLSP